MDFYPGGRVRGQGRQGATGDALGAHQQLQADHARALARAEGQEHQAQTLFAMSQAVTVTMDLDDLRQSIVDSLYDALRADTASLFLREADGHLRMVAQRNIDITRARIIFGPDEGLVALAAHKRKLVHVPDTNNSTHYVPTGYDPPRSLLAVPVEPQSGPSYVLCVVRRRVYAFTDDELQFANLIGSVAAHALSNAALYREMHALAREQATLYDLMRAATLSDGVTSFIGRAVEPLRGALEASGCAIVLVDPATPSQHRSASHGMSPYGLGRCEAFADEQAEGDTIVPLRLDASPEGSRLILATVSTRAHPVAVIAWERLVGDLRAKGKTHSAHDDIWDGSQPLGDELSTARLPQFAAHLPLSDAETSFITNVSQQVALGIDNLRLRARDMAALRSISALPASRPHLDELRHAIVNEVADAFAPAEVALIVRDDPGGAPQMLALSRGSAGTWVRAALHLISEGNERNLLQGRGMSIAALEADGETLGWLALRPHAATRLSADRALVFSSIAGTVALLLRNARLHLIAREAAVDRERHRIAREIHDGVAQNLAHLMLRLELVQRLVYEAPDKAASEAEGARQVLLTSLNDLRGSIAALAPAQLDELGFSGAVGALMDDILTNVPELAVTFSGVPEGAIPLELRAPAFRVVQEALSNIRKHAHARHAWIDVGVDGDRALVVTVRDDGAGFTPDPTAPAHGHFGLRGMHERAEEFGGALAITSAPKQGTTVTLTLPLRLAA